MFGNDKSIDNLQQLFIEIKKYIELQKEYVTLDVVEKLTIIISTLISVLIFIILAMIALLFLSFTLAYLLAPYVGGMTGSYAIITGIIVTLIILIAVFRKKLIVQPLICFLGKILLNRK